MRLAVSASTLYLQCFKGQTQKMRIEINNKWGYPGRRMSFKGQTQKMRIEIEKHEMRHYNVQHVSKVKLKK